MATVNFLFRSTRSQAPLNVRLLFRHNFNDKVIGGKIKLEVSKDYWENFHFKKRIKDVEIKNRQAEITSRLSEIENHILAAYNSTNPARIDKQWLNSIIESFYTPQGKKDIPIDFLSYIDFYLDYRKNEMSDSNRKKVNILKNKMLRLENEYKIKILISEINEDFKKIYVDYSNMKKYSQNTQQRELVLIKTICFHARHHGLKTHYQLDGLRLQREVSNHIYLNRSELEKIKMMELPHDYLENVRDWLLISCFTGQRVSDFMRFTPGMIRNEDNKWVLEFRQRKTKKLMTIPVSKELREVLKKRNGNFPRPISDQRYNEYIKEVCQLAGINEKVTGKRRKSIAPIGRESDKNDYRDIVGTFEKWELVTSHIGRRSFATNYYGEVPTTYLINITGHGSEKMFLNYIKKSNKDLAMDAYKYFN